MRSRQTTEELEVERDRLEVEEEVVDKRANIAEKKAVIAQLKERYGSKWKRILGASGALSLADLKGLLGQAKKGMKSGMYSGGSRDHPLNPLPPDRMRGDG